MDQYSSTLDQIQRLSNERQHLYLQKWSKRNRPTYREIIKRLDKRIADLWHEHRCELASAARRTVPPKDVEPAIVQDYFQHKGTPLPLTSYQVKDGDGWLAVDDNVLTEGISRWVADIPLGELEEVDPTPPLKEVLRKRGLTLRWESAKGGSGYHRLVSSST